MLHKANKEHWKSPLNLLIELLLVGAGVFLALLANNWHEARQHHELARITLRNFAKELRTNREDIQGKRAYHETLAREVRDVAASDEHLDTRRFFTATHWQGLRPVFFEHTAWDLAVATQALTYIPSDLAFTISSVYTQQNAFQTYENSFVGAVLTPANSSDARALAASINGYLIDVNIREAALLEAYDKVIPEVEQAIRR
ncbi:MAG: hypothetical protein JO354_09400 [Verrucomicrobia bacterium]|nr:hypothetical protein [Verrucomicrobiota bacterium]